MNYARRNVRQSAGVLMMQLLFLSASVAAAEPQPEQVTIETRKLAPGLYLFASHQGGNVVVSDGTDGVLVIDDEMAHLSPALQKAIAGLTDRTTRFILNTHWHFDHVGGNELLSGDGAVIVAHENVRRRMATGQHITALNMDIPPASPAALPVLTFTSDVTIHWNGDTLEVVHPARAHTDGDAIVYFRTANVVHMGDLFWNGVFPLIDGSSGGSTTGMIAAVAAVLDRIGDDTQVIPGHGPLANKARLREFHAMLADANARISKMRDDGMTLDEVVQAKPLADLDAAWGGGFIKTDDWVRIVYTVP